MMTFVTDGQVVGESVSTLFSMLQQGPIEASVFIKNSGLNTLNYRFQYWDGSAWVDMGTSGSDFYNTLMAGEVRALELSTEYPRVQLIGNASGGAFLDFSITRYYNRTSGGSLPLMTL